MLIGAGEDDHHDHRDDDGGDHHAELVDHADRGDHRVEREDDVEQHDLHDHAGERRRHARRAVALVALELLVDLVRALGDQEQAADEQDQVAARRVLEAWTVNSGAVSRMIHESERAAGCG